MMTEKVGWHSGSKIPRQKDPPRPATFLMFKVAYGGAIKHRGVNDVNPKGTLRQSERVFTKKEAEKPCPFVLFA